MTGDSGNTAGPGLNTGGAGPKPSKDWKKSGGNVDGGRTGRGTLNPGNTPGDADDDGLANAKPVWSGAGASKGYTVISESPAQTDKVDWGQFHGAQHPKGISPDLKRDGSYTGGRGSGS